MKQIATFFALIQLVILSSPVLAQDAADYYGARTVTSETWVEEWDAASGQWVRVADRGAADADLPTITSTASFVTGGEVREAARYALPSAPQSNATMLAQYGPFVVTSATRAAMVGSTDSASPSHFDAMIRDFPELAVLDLVEAPGTSNDIANLAVARRIRANGIATHVPNGGSVRSGAVELFLAGATRTLEEGAMFAVHSWLDNHGNEADDFPADHAAHRLYLDFYVEMGMSEERARGFYDMTNSVPHADALWLRAADMRPWLHAEAAPKHEFAQPVIMAAAQPALTVVEFVGADAAVELDVPAIDYSDLDSVNLAILGSDALTQG
ncbi:alpha/beta hydrolase [uncultured Erythrobacter sp.]|uniref:alpha/beta hydrolase n=1 Tax=uncultured Erythrobacter sp. TaxID=263913 RepID=UPI0026129A14|nr:alpha/beta hydrolase [uncultured Erythrobacter sp.]